MGKSIKPTKKQFIDRFLRVTIRNNRPDLDFDCPASIVFKRHENKDEAINKWLTDDPDYVAPKRIIDIEEEYQTE